MSHYLVTVTPRDSSTASPQALYLLAGPELTPQAVARLTAELLHDPVVQAATWCALAELPAATQAGLLAEIAYKPGVTDNEAESVLEGARRLGLTGLKTVRTLRRYPLAAGENAAERYNDLIQTVLIYQGTAAPAERRAWYEHLLETPAPVAPHVARVPIRSADDAELQRISKTGVLALDLAEMQAIRAYYASVGRDPTDGELETIAQTWSEHCSHKTFKARVRYRRRETGDGRRETGDQRPETDEHAQDAEHNNLSASFAPSAVKTTPDLYPAYHILEGGEVEINSLIKTFLMSATQQVLETRNSQLVTRNSDWVLSAFVDNAGIIAFTDDYEVSFKVETHNHPSALEPFGGANTGVGGVIRDVLGVSAKPIANTDVLCFGPFAMAEPPPGVLHPRRVCQGVVAGVRDYGNKLGIPTVNGAVLFDEGYTANPLVFCGTVGLAPRGKHPRNVQPGDAVVVLGGRTGRDGIHGATFSSEELTHTTAEEVGSAVQIGDPITEKKLLDVLLQARDMGLYSAITDCGAGGLSSAVGEMGAETGAVVELEHVPLKYAGLQPWEIWLSEAQERMVLAVPPQHLPAFLALCEAEDVEASAIGHFTDDQTLRVLHGGASVVELGMAFLHDGRPQRVLEAVWEERTKNQEPRTDLPQDKVLGSRFSVLAALKMLLAHPNIASKERIVRTYDHEVGGATVIKPLVGAALDGPGNAAVLQPLRHSMAGLAVGCGINPRYGRIDPYWMALACVDEALRNVVAVGGDPNQTAILDNFCWGDPRLPDRMAGLVRAAAGCYDAAVAFGTPYISGKDSLNNEYRDAAGNRVAIPPTLLISALAHVPDVRQCVTMDAKEPGNYIYLLGETRNELGGSHLTDLRLTIDDLRLGGVLADNQSPIANLPKVDLAAARRTFAALHGAMRAGLVRACHDLSEGGLAVAAAEMAIAGELGIQLGIEGVELRNSSTTTNESVILNAQRSILYSETPSRFLVEVAPANAAAFESAMAEVVLTRLGTVQASPQFVVRDGDDVLIDVSVADLKAAWQGGLEGSGL